MAGTELPITEEQIQTLLAKGGHPSGITKLQPGTDQYNAAIDLIAYGVTFDSCSAGSAGTIKRLSDLPKERYNRYKKYPWASSARLDSQGDIKHGNHSYARLAIQMQNYTNAQANVQIGVTFGKRGIRRTLTQSLEKADVIWLSSNKEFIAKATALGHSVVTLEMCQELAGEEDPVGSAD